VEYAFDGLLEMIKMQLSGMNELECIEAINYIKQEIDKMNPIQQPVSTVKWVPADMVVGNDYNPNHVAPPEMKLLYRSIKEDGYTQPIVVMWDEEKGKYVVIDGFHRNRVGKEHKDINAMIKNHLPIVELKKSINERMASTIRHNRARGKHSIDGMTNIVAEMMLKGWDDEKVAKELGMDLDELLRLKQNTGLAELFKDKEFSRSWE